MKILAADFGRSHLLIRFTREAKILLSEYKKETSRIPYRGHLSSRYKAADGTN